MSMGPMAWPGCRWARISIPPIRFHLSRSRRLRFRLNATPTRTPRRDGGNVVMRPIADMPPPLSDQLVEQGILDNYRPGHGMVIVSGATGSGKSTLIAGMTVAKLLDPTGNFDIIEGAAPVEFLLERVRGPTSTMNQTEIPRDLPSFAAFVRGAMRREPTDIIVGECRDSETMDAAIQAAISGHVLTTTIHANNVPLTMQRIASLCPPGERENLISAVAQSLRLIINQRLARSARREAHAPARISGVRCRSAKPIPAHGSGRVARADQPRRRGEGPVIQGGYRERGARGSDHRSHCRL